MNPRLADVIPDKSTDDIIQASNLVKEGLQELILCELSHEGFFDRAVFHGGTCLRILHGLDRFSEDLDFTLREKDLDFDFQPYADALAESLKEIGLSATVYLRKPQENHTIYSAKIKIDFREALEISGFTKDLIQKSHSKTLVVVKIDIDIDIDPPVLSSEEMVKKTSPLEYSEDGTSPSSIRWKSRSSTLSPMGQPRKGQGHVRLPVVHQA